VERRSKNKLLDDYFENGIDRASGIAAAYRSRDYSQRQIADYCGISTVSRSLRDQKNVRGSNLYYNTKKENCDRNYKDRH